MKLTDENIVDPENSHLFSAMGAALEAGDAEYISIDSLTSRLEKGVAVSFEMPRLDPLFADETEYDEFCERHNKAILKKDELSEYEGECFLGIDAGSTTTKLTLIGSQGQLLYSYYSSNQGSPIETAKKARQMRCIKNGKIYV